MCAWSTLRSSVIPDLIGFLNYGYLGSDRRSGVCGDVSYAMWLGLLYSSLKTVVKAHVLFSIIQVSLMNCCWFFSFLDLAYAEFNTTTVQFWPSTSTSAFPQGLALSQDAYPKLAASLFGLLLTPKAISVPSHTVISIVMRALLDGLTKNHFGPLPLPLWEVVTPPIFPCILTHTFDDFILTRKYTVGNI